MKGKVYRTVYTVEVLSDSPIEGDLSLTDIKYKITDGGCSGVVKELHKSHRLTGKDAVKVIQDQGTDPEFFNMDEEGNELDGDDETWTDPAGGTHYGNDDDPAASYI